jgi:hypothetical protein
MAAPRKPPSPPAPPTIAGRKALRADVMFKLATLILHTTGINSPLQFYDPAYP